MTVSGYRNCAHWFPSLRVEYINLVRFVHRTCPELGDGLGSGMVAMEFVRWGRRLPFTRLFFLVASITAV